MGHKIFLLLIISIFFFNECRSQYNLEWAERTPRPDSSTNDITDLTFDKSGNLILLGYRYSIAKMDQHSNLIWNVAYPLPGFFMSGQSYAVGADDSGNVYMTGEQSPSFNNNFLTIKYDYNGIFQWSRTYDNPMGFSDRAYKLIVYKNKYLYIAGSNSYGDSGTGSCNFKWTIFKYDLNGNEIWRYQYCGFSQYVLSDYAPIPKLAIDSSGNVIISGDNVDTTNFSYSNELKIIKLDSSGIQLWIKTIKKMSSSETLLTDVNSNIYVGANGILKFNSNGDSLWFKQLDNLKEFNIDTNRNLISARYNNINQSYYVIINKIDTSGNNIWTAQTPSVLFPASIYTNQNNKIFLSAYSTGSGNQKYYTYVYNSDGSLFWNGEYVNTSGTGCRPIKIISDKNDNIYVSGNAYTVYPDVTILTVKYSLLTGNSNSNSVSVFTDKFFLNQNYPNPFNPNTVINYELRNASLVKMIVYDVLGNEVATLINEYKSVGSHEIEFDGSDFSSGIYFYRIEAGSFIQTKKMLLLK